jgi:hypothetical protein
MFYSLCGHCLPSVFSIFRYSTYDHFLSIFIYNTFGSFLSSVIFYLWLFYLQSSYVRSFYRWPFSTFDYSYTLILGYTVLLFFTFVYCKKIFFFQIILHPTFGHFLPSVFSTFGYSTFSHSTFGYSAFGHSTFGQGFV